MIVLFKFFARLPLWLVRALGLGLGWLIWLTSGRYRRLMKENWRVAIDSGRLGIPQRKDGPPFRAAIGHAGLIATELPRIWCDSLTASQITISGLELLKAMAKAGKGVILLTPHLGAFELSARVIARHVPITVLYRPARQPQFRRLMEALRPTKNLMTAPANASGVRQLLRTLRAGGVIGMLPDQVPSGGEGVWADFFGRPAYTMTLPIRLAQATGAPIVWVLAIRTQAGWHLEFAQWRTDQEFVGAPLQQVVAAMNLGLEQQIARAPEQYLWAYNRYKVPRGHTLPESHT